MEKTVEFVGVSFTIFRSPFFSVMNLSACVERGKRTTFREFVFPSYYWYFIVYSLGVYPRIVNLQIYLWIFTLWTFTHSGHWPPWTFTPLLFSFPILRLTLYFYTPSYCLITILLSLSLFHELLFVFIIIIILIVIVIITETILFQ